MRSFIPEGSQIDSRWYSAWGEQFGIPELAGDMANNPRIADRMTLSVFESMKIDVRSRFGEDEIVPVAQFIDDRNRLTNLCGLVMHGELIRTQVCRTEFEALCKVFSVEDLQIAACLPELHGGRSEFGFEINKLPELVLRSGKACIQAWKTGLSEQMALRLQLLETEEETQPEDFQQVSAELSSAIVLAVSRKLCGVSFAAAA